jgi:hypothetical protein
MSKGVKVLINGTHRRANPFLLFSKCDMTSTQLKINDPELQCFGADSVL